MGGSPVGLASSHKPPQLHGHDKYDVEDGLRTMEQAEAIKSKPGLHGAIKKHAASKARNMRKIAGKR
jgi:hypothetical protein